MRYLTLALFSVCAAALVGCSAASVSNLPNDIPTVPAAASAPGPRQPVLVELFTSEGCSSCPPADRALAFLKKEQPVAGAEVIALAYHVDYWNHIGWTDRFSSHEFSLRQESYTGKFALDSIYTPQMIVDGNTQFTGSDTGKAVGEIGNAVKATKGRVELSFGDGELKADLTDLTPTGDSTIFLAIAEDNLSSSVERGENRGQTLQHVSVVRELREIGKAGPAEKRSQITAEVDLKPEWKKADLQLIVFVQDARTKVISAIGTLKPQF
jgi:hypothetical protein